MKNEAEIRVQRTIYIKMVDTLRSLIEIAKKKTDLDSIDKVENWTADLADLQARKQALSWVLKD